MDFLINESQLRKILIEQDESKMTDYMKELHSFTNNVVNTVIKKYKINVKMFLTWGASIGGLMMPLDNYIKNRGFEITTFQSYLIILGVGGFLLFENKRVFDKIYKKIQEEGIEDVFKNVLEKGIELKSVFLDFLGSLNVSMNSFTDAVVYAFLVPIFDDIYNVANGSLSVNESAQLITERLISSGVVLAGSTILYNLLKKMIQRFRR